MRLTHLGHIACFFASLPRTPPPPTLCSSDDDDTVTECPELCEESHDSQPWDILSYSPVVLGAVAGTMTFLVLMILMRCCCGSSSSRSGSGANYHKAGQIELADSQNGGGYRDEDLDGEYGVDSFEDE